MTTREARIEEIKERIRIGREKCKQRKQAVQESWARQEKRRQHQLQRLTNLERVKERKLDTRRKILAGAAAFEKYQSPDQGWTEVVHQLDLNSFLKRDNDRELFDLAPLEPERPDPPRHDG